MEIEDAFTEEAISAAGTNVGGDVEDALRAIVEQIFTSNNLQFDRGHINVALLAFVAGRTYQQDSTAVQVTMTVPLVSEFLRFLVEGRSDA